MLLLLWVLVFCFVLFGLFIFLSSLLQALLFRYQHWSFSLLVEISWSLSCLTSDYINKNTPNPKPEEDIPNPKPEEDIFSSSLRFENLFAEGLYIRRKEVLPKLFYLFLILGDFGGVMCDSLAF